MRWISQADFPLAAKAVKDSFFVDVGLTGTDSIDEAIELYHQLLGLFGKGGFLLRKWSSSEFEVIPTHRPRASRTEACSCNLRCQGICQDLGN